MTLVKLIPRLLQTVTSATMTENVEETDVKNDVLPRKSLFQMFLSFFRKVECNDVE